MSNEHEAAGHGPETGATDPAAPDPSMEDILASIRRILNEEDGGTAPGDEPHPPLSPSTAPQTADVLELDQTMMLPDPEPVAAAPVTPAPAPAASPMVTPPIHAAAEQPPLVAPEAAAAAAMSVGALIRTLATERGTQVNRGGPTIEDLVREEVRPVLKEWLDSHLPPMVERLVRAEIERVVSRMT